MKIIILDTETTGTLEEDRICQLSYLVVNEQGDIEEVYDDLCLPPLPLKVESMAVHHIVPEDLEGKPSCIDTKAYQHLLELNTPDNLMIIQNAVFDIDMLAKEGFEFNMKLIDTFRVMRAKYPLDGGLGLQHKRYQWKLYQKEQEIIDKLGVEVKAHDALGDVIVLKNLYDYIRNDFENEMMIELCKKPILLEYMPFGKHKEKRIEDLALSERNNLEYMMRTFDLDIDMKYTLDYYLTATRGQVPVVMGFGKYKGKTPLEVLELDRGYLEWMRDKAENISEDLKEAIVQVLK